jgi:hypothetical protein
VFRGEALVISRGRMLVNLLRCGGEEQGRRERTVVRNRWETTGSFLRFLGKGREGNV